MAYCEKCGAYIPDDLTACYACGFDGAAGYAYAYDDNYKRQEAEERRKAKQQQQREWAEAEYADRKKQEENRRWAEAEAEGRRKQQQYSRNWQDAEAVRRRREQEARQRWEDMKVRTSAMGAEAGRMHNAVKQEAERRGKKDGMRKLLGFLSYCGILFLIPLLGEKDDEFLQFHAKQGMRLFIFNVLSTALTAFIPLAGLVKLAGLYMFIEGVSNALNGREKTIPFIGDIKI